MKVGRNSEIEGSSLRTMAHRGACEVSLAEDLARVRAVRETIGSDVRLMVDANGGLGRSHRYHDGSGNGAVRHLLV